RLAVVPLRGLDEVDRVDLAVLAHLVALSERGRRDQVGIEAPERVEDEVVALADQRVVNRPEVERNAADERAALLALLQQRERDASRPTVRSPGGTASEAGNTDQCCRADCTHGPQQLSAIRASGKRRSLYFVVGPGRSVLLVLHGDLPPWNASSFHQP